MSDPVLDIQQSSIPSLLASMTVEVDTLKKLNAIDTILNALDDDVAQKVKAKSLKKFLRQNYLSNVTFMRQLKLYTSMMGNTELSVELLGSDYISHPEFCFNEELEEEISELNLRLNRIIGILLKEYQTGEKVEF